MIESKETPVATLMIEMYYHCPECFSKHTWPVSVYKCKKEYNITMVDICHDCGEIFEIEDKM